jgi:hypothetical protein
VIDPYATGPQFVDRQDIETALLKLEKVDRDMANMLRNYIRSLESRLELYEGQDLEPE